MYVTRAAKALRATLQQCRVGNVRFVHESNAPIPPTGIVMLNMGGPPSLDGVQPFLQNLFTDKEIIRLGPLQNTLGPFIAARRTPRIRQQYAAIGGKSPIGDWTRYQGDQLVKVLRDRHQELGPFKHYIAFRYAPPLTEQALLQMKADGVKRAVAFTQYPQHSCTTTGSSINHLWREVRRLGLEEDIKWSVVDRWGNHPLYIKAMARRVALGLQSFDPEVRDRVVIIFSAHSIPMMIVNRGDAYTTEIGGTVQLVMDALRRGVPMSAAGDASTHNSTIMTTPSSPYVLSWQSKVGFLPWMGPSTADVLTGLGKKGCKHVLIVPIAFTSDHIETLFEIDMEYKELAEKAGIHDFRRAPSLNDEPLLADCMADIIATHISENTICSPQYPMRCAGCVNPECRKIVNPAAPYKQHFSMV